MDTRRPTIPIHTAPDAKRPSIQMKRGSYRSESGSFSNGVSKTPLKAILSSSPSKTKVVTPTIQLFLCIMGSLISVSICVWLGFFSHDSGWRRVLFASGSALCSVMFAYLAFTTIRRAHQPPQPVDEIPNLMHRRSTVQGRLSGKRSVSGAPPVSSSHDEGDGVHSPTTVLVVGDKTRPSLIAPSASSSN